MSYQTSQLDGAVILRRLVSRVEQRVGPLPEFGKNILAEGAIAAAISIVGTIAIWLAIVLIGSIGVGSGSGESATSSTSGSSGIAAVALAIASANTIPMHVSVSAGASFISGGVDIVIHSPPTLLTIFALLGGAIGGYRAGQKYGTGWPAGLGVALVYATIVTLTVAVFSSHSELTNIGSGSSVSYGISPALPSGWFYAFAWPLVPALIGALGGRGAALAYARARTAHPLLGAWRASIIGSLWAFGISLAGCLIVSFIGLLFAASSNSIAPDAGWKIVGLFVLFAPVTMVYTFSLGLGASLGLSSDPSQLLEGTRHSVTLLGDWPLTNWAYLLPLLVLAGCIVGALKALSLAPQRSTAYKMLVPFTLLSLICAWLSSISATIRADDSLASLIRTAGEFVNLGSLGDTIASAATSGITVGFGPSLFEVALGSLVLMAVGAAVACYLWQPLTQSPLLTSQPSPAGGYSAGFATADSPRGAHARSGGRLRPSEPTGEAYGYSVEDTWQPPVPDMPTALANSSSRAPTHADRQRIALSSVSIPPSTSTQPPLQRRICPQCGRVSTDTSTCPGCNAPLGGS